MATRQENAKKINEAFNVELNLDNNDLRAALLERWAKGLEADREATEKEVLRHQVKSLRGIEPPEGLSASDLRSFLVSTVTPGTEDYRNVRLPPGVAEEMERERQKREAAERAQRETESVATAALSVPAEPATKSRLRVSLADGASRYGGTYTDPDQAKEARVIRGKPIEVAETHLIRLGLRNGTLVRRE